MSLANPRILVIEDEPSQVELLRYNFTRQGFQVDIADDGEEGLLAAKESPPDLILLDWMLPNLSGIEVCRQLRRDKRTREIPIIMLTARSEERDKIRGLDIGADDYVSKPYLIKELTARVRAALRRPIARVFSGQLTVGALDVDIEKHTVSLAGKRLQTSPTEFRLLVTLMQSPGRVFSRTQLLDLVWGISSDVDTRTVDVHIGRLRRTLKQAGCGEMVRTERGFGYAIDG
ncbi:response regulator [Aliiroseovarius subalbicans]|uniref:response regulator n=1 Tax=Aliiroseovarius subalbicans TaxID=2925840 RepID=UPI001F564964|nr:response regulator [Aliiroseovarius subalbicans]MCI2400331.1 response regulator [Aliiroseovarius subalbicans]